MSTDAAGGGSGLDHGWPDRPPSPQGIPLGIIGTLAAGSSLGPLTRPIPGQVISDKAALLALVYARTLCYNLTRRITAPLTGEGEECD